ncbi:MAG: hypothetical protein EZS28_053055, partial [Streblomastix strix]
MFTQIGCTADLITGLQAKELTPSGLKNLVCDINPVTVSVRNYIITGATANMSGYKASDTCLNRVRQFYSQRPFVVPAQRIETWAFPSGAALTGLRTTVNIGQFDYRLIRLIENYKNRRIILNSTMGFFGSCIVELTDIFCSQNIPLSHVTDMCLIFPKDPRHVTCFENPCYQNMQVSTLGRNFPDFPMNTLNEQFFTMQLQANNLDAIFEATDEYEDSLATPRGSATRRYNP